MRIIGHLDCDAFFASVEERDKPHLKGRPIVVGADPEDGHGRGVVSTANYAARRYGIRSAMSIREAWERAEAGRREGGPEVAWISPRGGRYGEVSREIMSIVARAVPQMEQTSVDECYLDLSFTGSFGAAEKLARELQREIEKKECLTVSIGIGPNKLIAKIASDQKKPRGLTVVGSDEPEECARRAQEFLEPMPIRAIPGIGPKTEAAFARKGVSLIKEFRRFSEAELTAEFGVRGAEFHRRIRGEDDSPLVFEYEAKSVGEQTTFAHDTRDPQFLVSQLQELCAGTFRAFRAEGFSEFKKAVITVRFGDFTTVSRGRTLPVPARTLAEMEFEAMKLFMPFLDQRENPRGKSFRLLGVRLERLA